MVRFVSGFEWIVMAFRVGHECAADFVSDPPGNGQRFFLSAGCERRIIEAPVMTVQRSGKHRVRLIRFSADGFRHPAAIRLRGAEFPKIIREDRVGGLAVLKRGPLPVQRAGPFWWQRVNHSGLRLPRLQRLRPQRDVENLRGFVEPVVNFDQMRV